MNHEKKPWWWFPPWRISQQTWDSSGQSTTKVDVNHDLLVVVVVISYFAHFPGIQMTSIINILMSDDGLKHVKTTKQIYRALETPVFCMAKPQIPADIMRSGWDTIDVCNPNMWKSMRDHCKYQPHISVEVQMKPQGCRPVMTIRKWQKHDWQGKSLCSKKTSRCWNSWDFPIFSSKNSWFLKRATVASPKSWHPMSADVDVPRMDLQRNSRSSAGGSCVRARGCLVGSSKRWTYGSRLLLY